MTIIKQQSLQLPPQQQQQQQQHQQQQPSSPLLRATNSRSQLTNDQQQQQQIQQHQQIQQQNQHQLNYQQHLQQLSLHHQQAMNDLRQEYELRVQQHNQSLAASNFHLNFGDQQLVNSDSSIAVNDASNQLMRNLQQQQQQQQQQQVAALDLSAPVTAAAAAAAAAVALNSHQQALQLANYQHHQHIQQQMETPYTPTWYDNYIAAVTLATVGSAVKHRNATPGGQSASSSAAAAAAATAAAAAAASSALSVSSIGSPNSTSSLSGALCDSSPLHLLSTAIAQQQQQHQQHLLQQQQQTSQHHHKQHHQARTYNPKKSKLSQYQLQVQSSESELRQEQAISSASASTSSSPIAQSPPICADVQQTLSATTTTTTTTNGNKKQKLQRRKSTSPQNVAAIIDKQQQRLQQQQHSHCTNNSNDDDDNNYNEQQQLAADLPKQQQQQQQQKPKTVTKRKYKGEFDEPTIAEVAEREASLFKQDNFHAQSSDHGHCACVLGSQFKDRSVESVLTMLNEWKKLDISERTNTKWRMDDLPLDIPLGDIKKWEEVRLYASNGRSDFGGASKRKPLGIRGTRQFLLILYCLWGHPGRQDYMQRQGYCPHCFARIKRTNEQSTLVRVVNHFNMKHRHGTNPRLSPSTTQNTLKTVNSNSTDG